jgi:hypothetical protein
VSSRHVRQGGELGGQQLLDNETSRQHAILPLGRTRAESVIG